MSLESDISDILAYYWLEGHPYCGIRLTEIFRLLRKKGEAQLKLHTIRDAIRKMRERDEVSTEEIQRDLMVFPKRALLEPRDPLDVEDVGVYTKQLRLGGSQMELRFFKRQVLDRYCQDPRYRVSEYGASGFLSIKDHYYLAEDTSEEDKVGIKSFGTAYLEDGTQVITVMLVYLGQLSKTHQDHWSSFEVHEKCLLDPDFVKTSFKGEFTERVSPFVAFVGELQEVNKLCDLMGEPHLFRNSYQDGPPKEFGWITKPTVAEFEALVVVTYKLIFDNLNKDFFKGKVDFVMEIPMKKGKIKVKDKSPLKLLTEYLQQCDWFVDCELKTEAIQTFEEIYNLRHGPAHSISEDDFDPSYFERQKRFVYKAYAAIRTLRIILMNHPSVKEYEPPRWLRDGRIV